MQHTVVCGMYNLALLLTNEPSLNQTLPHKCAKNGAIL